MNRFTLTLLTVAASGITALGILAPAPAVAGTTTTVVSPANGSEVPLGNRSVTVQFGYDDDYEIDVDGPGQYADWRYYSASAGESHTFTGFDAMNTAGSYTVKVYDGWGDLVAKSAFSVLAPPVKLTDPSVSLATFYPVVRDGYKDSTKIRYRLNARADMTAEVFRTSNGHRVQAVDFGYQRAGKRAWTWNGRTKSGDPAPAGKYRIKISAVDTEGNTDSVKSVVTAMTKQVTRRTSKAVNGNHTSSTSHRGNCYANRSSYFGEINLDCWGGKFAQATYRFSLPASAKKLSWSARGEVNCCDRGKITRTGTRTAPRVFRVLVKVTNWRSFTVSRVSVTYSYTVQL